MVQTQSLSTECKTAAATHLHDNIAGSQAAAALDREQELVRALVYRHDVDEVLGGPSDWVRDEFGVDDAPVAIVKKARENFACAALE